MDGWSGRDGLLNTVMCRIVVRAKHVSGLVTSESTVGKDEGDRHLFGSGVPYKA